jgi:hypothetical protein
MNAMAEPNPHGDEAFSFPRAERTFRQEGGLPGAAPQTHTGTSAQDEVVVEVVLQPDERDRCVTVKTASSSSRS